MVPNCKILPYRLVYLWLGLLSIVVFFLLLIIRAKDTKANFAYFYPQTCLGSFINPEKAQGGLEAKSLDEVNENNSAVYLGGFKEIYCGNFHGPIKESTEIKRINLKFNLLLTEKRIETPIIESTSSPSFIEKIFPSRELEIINTSSHNENEGNLNEQPSSFLFPFSFVFAQEQNNELNSNNNQSTSSLTELDINSSSTFFDIFYTLDGENWDYLASLTAENWRNFSISIPVNDWFLISKIQIKIQSNPLLDNIPYLYLEAVVLEIEHEDKKNESDENKLSTECLELEKKINLARLEIHNSTSSEVKDENRYNLTFQKSIDSYFIVYQFEKGNDYESWIYDRDNRLCKKLIGLNLQNFPFNIHGHTLFYVDENRVLNGYDLISGNMFSLTFENSAEIPLGEKRKLILNLIDKDLIIKEEIGE
ncbi:MAG: hypothetical protein NZ822_03270 [Patescibacteria group bacterium]|nr:hypothetical protein [Patescibacteria group bacterium]